MPRGSGAGRLWVNMKDAMRYRGTNFTRVILIKFQLYKNFLDSKQHIDKL